MKKILTILFSMVFMFAIAQERTHDGPKPISHEPLACPSLVMTPVDGTITTASDLVESILGPDIQSYSNVTFVGAQGSTYASGGLFTGGTDAGIGILEGIVLSSGYISNAIGPNSSDNITADLDLAGDAQLSGLAGYGTTDATVLQFNFVPNFDQLYIEFVFGSDEYNFYVNSQYNDVFAFYLNGTNIAHVPSTNTPVSINTINLGLNSSYYKNNDYSEFVPGPFPYCNEMNGFTTVLVASGPVNANQVNTIKLAIADGSDHYLDSWVMIKKNSFGGTDPEVPVSNWALYIGIFLILTFAVIRFRKLV